MEPRRWENIQAAFTEIVELDDSERRTRLAALGATDPELRVTVEALLEGDAEVEHRLTKFERLRVFRSGNDLSRFVTAVADRYHVQRELGSGGMAMVYLAQDLKHQRAVALKVLKPELASALGGERFLREIALTARLEHPHILPLLDSGRVDGLLYYVMPYVEGESLRDRLNREKQLSLDDALEITREVADALSYAHSRGIIHRDIKPANILLSGGHTRVADLGIAVALSAAGGDRLTETGLAVGTPVYMSPEQAGDRALDARSDVYSLACVVYEMLAGQPPYTGATAEAILARKSLEAPPSLRVVRDAVPVGVEHVITKALAKVPVDRFATAAEFANALEHARRTPSPLGPSRQRVPRRRLLFGAIALLLTLSLAWWGSTRLRPSSPQINSLAVLPLKNLMSDPEQEYFVEGMHEALTTELSKIGGLKVISRATAMRYRETTKTMPQIAHELGVEGLIDGSVLREGGQVRITVHLIHGPSDRHLWADSYQRELRGILTLQTEVSRAIANQIQAKLTPAEESRLAITDATNPEAYEAYLRGRYFYNRWPAPEYARCVEHFRLAIERATNWADAHAGLSTCYTMLSWDQPPKDVLPRARVAAQRALELDPNHAEAIVTLGWVSLFYDWNWEAAAHSARRALELSPNNPSAHALHSNYLAFLGAFEDAIREAQQSVRLDPGSLLMNRGLAFVYQLARRYPDYAVQARVTLELAPENLVAKFDLAWAYALQGTREKTVTELNEAALISAVLLATLGDRAPALKQVKVVEAQRADFYVDAFWVAVVYAALKEADDAFRWLTTAYEERSASMVQLKTNPLLDPIRDDARFHQLMRRMKFPT